MISPKETVVRSIVKRNATALEGATQAGSAVGSAVSAVSAVDINGIAAGGDPANPLSGVGHF
jgi:hypothetical protein